jgi:hypothetical protein
MSTALGLRSDRKFPKAAVQDSLNDYSSIRRCLSSQEGKGSQMVNGLIANRLRNSKNISEHENP